MKDSGSPDFRVTPRRFERERDGHLAFIDYRLRDSVANFIHTEVPEDMQGKGVGSELVRSALDWARQKHIKVIPSCPFVAAYLKRHPEYADLLAK